MTLIVSVFTPSDPGMKMPPLPMNIDPEFVVGTVGSSVGVGEGVVPPVIDAYAGFELTDVKPGAT